MSSAPILLGNSRSRAMTYEEYQVRSRESRIEQLTAEIFNESDYSQYSQRVIQEKEQEIEILKAELVNAREDVTRVSAIVQRLIALNDGWKRDAERYLAAAAKSRADSRNAMAVATRDRHALQGAAMGAGVGAGTALFINAAVTTVSLPVAIVIIGVSACVGSEIG